MATITAAALRSLLTYDPETGRFHWRVRRNAHGGPVMPGDEAGHKADDGHVLIGVDGRVYRAHRLAWLYVHGVMPARVMHRNGQRDDNRLDNLQPGTPAQIARNLQRPHRDNLTGRLGVTLHAGGKYAAHICTAGRVRHIGLFATADAAHQAYAAEKRVEHAA